MAGILECVKMAKMCQISMVWFGRPILDTFLVISLDSVHIFQNRFLRWNRESEPLDLNTMNLIIRTIFFSLLKALEPFCRPFPQRKMAQIWFFKSWSLFSIYIYIQLFWLLVVSFSIFCVFHCALMDRVRSDLENYWWSTPNDWNVLLFSFA